jgi:hypothetical protein
MLVCSYIYLEKHGVFRLGRFENVCKIGRPILFELLRWAYAALWNTDAVDDLISMSGTHVVRSVRYPTQVPNPSHTVLNPTTRNVFPETQLNYQEFPCFCITRILFTVFTEARFGLHDEPAIPFSRSYNIYFSTVFSNSLLSSWVRVFYPAVVSVFVDDKSVRISRISYSPMSSCMMQSP